MYRFQIKISDKNNEEKIKNYQILSFERLSERNIIVEYIPLANDKLFNLNKEIRNFFNIEISLFDRDGNLSEKSTFIHYILDDYSYKVDYSDVGNLKVKLFFKKD